jgi:hypothetical protein
MYEGLVVDERETTIPTGSWNTNCAHVNLDAVIQSDIFFALKDAFDLRHNRFGV